MAKITCNVSEKHEKNFFLIKGALGAKNNGEALGAIVDRVLPAIKKEIAAKTGA